jgi:hypothetical protein
VHKSAIEYCVEAFDVGKTWSEEFALTRFARSRREVIMREGTQTAYPTISQILSEFLAAQERRLSGKSFSRYREVVELLRTSLNNYAYQGLCGEDKQRFESLYNAQGEEHRDFCEIFGAEQIVPNLREFLGYFMVRKVIAGTELMRAAGTVTKVLSKWLAEKGYVGAAESRSGAQHGAAAARDLPAARALARSLMEFADRQPAVDDCQEEPEEDQFLIAQIDNGRIWLERMDGHRLGPFAVPPTLARSARSAGASRVWLVGCGANGGCWKYGTCTRNNFECSGRGNPYVQRQETEERGHGSTGESPAFTRRVCAKPRRRDRWNRAAILRPAPGCGVQPALCEASSRARTSSLVTA